MNCWKFLNIEATLDKKLIKKAYSKLLRVYHPEKDATGFQQLKEAYDQAIRSAGEMSSGDVEDYKSSLIFEHNTIERIAPLETDAEEVNFASDVEDYNRNDQSSLIFEQDTIDLIAPLEVELTAEEINFVANEITPCQEYKEHFKVLNQYFDTRFSLPNWEKLFRLFDPLNFDEKQQSINDLIVELGHHPHLDLSIYQYIGKHFQLLNYLRDVISFKRLASLIGRSTLNNLLAYLKGEKIAIKSVHYLPLLGLELRVHVTDDIFSSLEKIEILNDKNRLPLQLEIINDLIRKHPQVHFLKIKRLYYLEQKTGYFEECLSVLDDLHDNPDIQLEKLIFLGEQAFTEKNFNQASVFFSEALKLDMESNRLVYKLVECHMKSGAFEIARPLLQDLVEQAPKNILFQIKCKQCAYAILKTKEFDLSSTEDFKLKIDLQFELKQYDEIINITDKYIDKSESVELKKIICIYKSKMYKNNKEYQPAFDYLSQSLNYARQLGENGNDEMVALLELLNANATYTPEPYKQESMLLQALLLFPGQAKILALLGAFNLRLKKDWNQAIESYSQAIESYLQVVDVDSHLYDCYEGRAYAFYYSKKYRLALTDFIAAKKQYPNDVNIFKFMAKSYIELNLNKEAVQEYSRLFEFTNSNNIHSTDHYNYALVCYRLLAETLYLSSMNYNSAEFIESVSYTGLNNQQLEIAKNCIEHIVPAINEYGDDDKLSHHTTGIMNMYVELSLCLFGSDRDEECQAAAEDGLKYINNLNKGIPGVDYFTNELNYILVEVITKEFKFSDRKSKEIQDTAENYFNKVFEYYDKRGTNDFLIARTTARYSNLYLHYYNNWDLAYYYAGIAIQRFNALRENAPGTSILFLYLRNIEKIHFEMAQCSAKKISNENLDEHWEGAIESASNYNDKIFYFFHQCRDYSYRRKDYATVVIKIDEFMKRWKFLKEPLPLPACSSEISIYELAAECFLKIQRPLEAYRAYEKSFELTKIQLETYSAYEKNVEQTKIKNEDSLHKMHEILTKLSHFLLSYRDIFNDNENEIITIHETFLEMAVLHWSPLYQYETFEQLTTIYIENGMGENIIKLITEHPTIDLEIKSRIKILAAKLT